MKRATTKRKAVNPGDKPIGAELRTYSPYTAQWSGWEGRNGYEVGEQAALHDKPMLTRDDMVKHMSSKVVGGPHGQELVDYRWEAYQRGYNGVVKFTIQQYSKKDAEKEAGSLKRNGFVVNRIEKTKGQYGQVFLIHATATEVQARKLPHGAKKSNGGGGVVSNPVAPRVQRSIDAASRWAELAAYSEHDAGRKYASVQKHFSDWARMSGNASTLEHFTAGERQRVKLAFAKAYAAEEKEAVGKQASNPAKSSAQYRLAQAVIGGTSTSSMPVAVAREIVKRNPPQTKYTVPELRALFYRLGYGMGKGDSASAAVGVDIKGDQEANFRFNLDKIIEYYQPVSEEQIVNLRGVFQVGYGHGYSGRPSVEKQFKSGKKKNPAKRTRKNPMDEADAMFESFHGEPPTETVEFVDELHVHHNLAACGDLVGFKVRTVSGYDATLEFENVILCTNEEGTHMYVRGGDQELDLEALHIDPAGKESVIVGEVWAVAYETEKDFDKFEEIQYVHLTGNEKFYKGVKQGPDLWEQANPPKDGAFECGNLPSLRYSTIDQLLYLDGGVYRIERPLVGTSAGIEG